MKICLIVPPVEQVKSFRDSSASYYIGLAYIAGSLLAKGIDCRIIDSKGEGLGFDETIEKLRIYKPDIVGISAMTHEIIRAAKLASKIKTNFPFLLIVIGGAHARTLQERTLEEFPHFDLVCTGEGERTMVNVVSAYANGSDFSHVKGIAYRKNGNIIINSPEELINDLDNLPFPAWQLFLPSKSYPILSSRGCPFSCNFCNRISGQKMRYRSAGNIVDEIEWLTKNFNCNKFGFYDEIFTGNKKRTLKLLDLMIGRGFSQKSVNWDCTTRADHIDLELVKKMKEAGCYHVAIGVESGNEEILERINKRETLEDIKNAVAILKSVGIKVHTYFIFGHPNETKKQAWDSVKFAAQLHTEGVSFGMMVPYPGTEIYKLAEKSEGGYRLLTKNWGEFEKYMGESLEFKNMSRTYVECLQIIGYLYFYVRNLRIIDLILFCKKHLSSIKFFIFSKLKKRRLK